MKKILFISFAILLIFVILLTLLMTVFSFFDEEAREYVMFGYYIGNIAIILFLTFLAKMAFQLSKN